MRQYLFSRCHSLFLASLVSSLLFVSGPITSVCLSQETTPSPGNVESEFDESSEYWKIKFPGGSIDAYLRMIRETAPKEYYPDINVVVVESEPGFELPSIEATATLDGFLGCLEACSNERYQVSITTDNRTEEITIIRVSALNPPPSVRVFNVKQILQSVNEEDFVQAIQTALEFSDSIEGIEMKLHAETGLLFAKGPFAGLEAIEETVQQLLAPPQVNSFNANPGGGSGIEPAPGGNSGGFNEASAGGGGDGPPR